MRLLGHPAAYFSIIGKLFEMYSVFNRALVVNSAAVQRDQVPLIYLHIFVSKREKKKLFAQPKNPPKKGKFGPTRL